MTPAPPGRAAHRIVAVAVCVLTSVIGLGVGAGQTEAGGSAVHGANLSVGASTSLDWAGYAVTGAPVHTVAGSWTQPTVTCPGPKLQQSAFWVGIDGFAGNDQTVEQVGTDADCTKRTAHAPSHPLHYAWYELYPDDLVVLPPATYPVAPGDVLTASVAVSGTSYVIDIADAGRWTFTTTQTPSVVPANASAEWITEAPTLCTGRCKVMQLASFGTVHFTGATVDGSTVAASGRTIQSITMTTKKAVAVKAAPTLLAPGGSAFDVVWQHV